MNTLHFKYAVEIEKTRSITQAAENLYMAQPNLSKAIKELENTTKQMLSILKEMNLTTSESTGGECEDEEL